MFLYWEINCCSVVFIEYQYITFLISGIVYAFNVQCPGNVQDQANANNVPIKKHNIIYRLMEDLVEELTNALPPGKVEETLGDYKFLEYVDGIVVYFI